MAELYRKRWSLETAFKHLEAYFHSEINTLGYPKAALFGFCLALVAYNVLAVVLAALRSVHGEETVDEEVSSLLYRERDFDDLLRHDDRDSRAPEWDVFYAMRTADLATILHDLAQRRASSSFPKKSSKA